jgi:iron complex transport system substrate-binding protein
MPRSLLAAALAAALITAGCGEDGEPAGSSAAAASSSGFPVTIAHSLGRTTIPEAPERIVVVGYTDQEPLLALGIRPVGAMDWFGEGTFARWEWEKRAWGGKPPEVVSNKAGEVDLEKVAELRPDLILALYAQLDRGLYDKLSQIAPTVAQAGGDPYTTPWRDMTRTAAKAVGRSEDGERLIRDVEARFAAFREDHPEVAGKTALVVDAGTAPKSYYPFTSGDQRGQFLRELGYKGSAEIDRLAGDSFGFEVSRERVDLLDVDRLFLLIDPPAQKRLAGDALFQRLAVARQGRVTALPYYSAPHLGAAVAFNSVLSLPYAIDGVEKALAAG